MGDAKREPKVTADHFIRAGVNLQKEDPELRTVVQWSKDTLRQRWHTPTGRAILAAWKASGFDRATIEQHIGKYYDHLDLRGIPLAGEDLSDRDVSFVDFYAADLRNTDFRRANLTESWLSEADIRGAKFDWAKMDGVLLDGVEFDHDTRFVGVNLNAVNFTLAALLQDLALYQQRIAHLEQRHPWLAFFLRVTSDYGRSLWRFTAWCALIVILFAGLYAHLWALDLSEALYVSLMLFLTIGVETPALPATAGARVALVVEALLGYVMMSLLIAILVRRTIGD